MESQSVGAVERQPPVQRVPAGSVERPLQIVPPLDVAAHRGFYVRVTKPLIDRMVSGLALVVLSPLMVAIAVGVLLTSGQPVFFRQLRVGKDGQLFSILKFRTMRQDRRKEAVTLAHPERRGYHKSDSDPRHTPFGRFLRRYSLDELPQLVNIVKGEMSLVGPRPELPHIVAGYEPWQHQRHLVRPGLTGPWQISARGEGHMHEFAHLDLGYVTELSFRNDLALLARTVPALITRKGH